MYKYIPSIVCIKKLLAPPNINLKFRLCVYCVIFCYSFTVHADYYSKIFFTIVYFY